MRHYIITPMNEREEYFILAYDIAIEKPFIRNSVILQFCSAQGFFNAEYFTLMLLDVFNNSDHLMEIVWALKYRAQSLMIILLLFVGYLPF